MDDNKALIDEIRSLIKSNVHPCYENTARTELYCKCPYCSKATSEPHFYIEMAHPFRVHCFKCGFAGRLNQSILNDLKIYNNDLVLNIAEVNREYNENHAADFHGKIASSASKKLIIEDPINERSSAALQYLNSRFNASLTLEEANKKFKCVCDIENFLIVNNIKIDVNRFDITKAIGFVSSDNTFLICRDITGTQAVRYRNIPIDTEQEVCSKNYNIRAAIDVLQPTVNLVITEGIFDIIGIYLAKYKGTPEEENTIFTAGCGKSFEHIIETYIKKGFLNMNVTIYSDADVDVKFYKDIVNYNSIIKQMPIKIFYNKLEKDVGVPADRIDLVEASL